MNLLVLKLVMYLIRNEWGYNLRISWKKMTILPVGVCVCVNHGFNQKFSLVFPYQWILGAAKIRGLVHPSFFPFCAILHSLGFFRKTRLSMAQKSRKTWVKLRHSSFYSGFPGFSPVFGVFGHRVSTKPRQVSSYFGAYAPRWFLGMGWALWRQSVMHMAYRWCWGDIKYWCSINVYDTW
jgi:hypothetical protein